MRPICWLHISDIHLRKNKEWSQDIVLQAMCRNIVEQRKAGTSADFILVTGDIAFAGNPQEYVLAEGFFDAIQNVSGVPKERIYCVAGNHDIDRTRQKLCFQGGRETLLSPSQVDELLEAGEDLKTLLIRQENYRKFQESYFKNQEKCWTEDELGYVSNLEIEEVRLAIIALNSAWLAEGGRTDHGQLIIGERQAINAIELAQETVETPNVLVGMAHHPLHLLREFDRRPVQHRLEEVCHFFHCGHLHEPEARVALRGGTSCLTLTAGALFETRHSQNAHYLVKLDVLHGTRQVDGFRFNPATGSFFLASSDTYNFEVSPQGNCRVGDLATAIGRHFSLLEPWAHYLSALVLDQKAEFPIPTQTGHAFGSFDVLQVVPNGELKHATIGFLTFRNILRVLFNRLSLSEILERHGTVIRRYGEALVTACNTEPALKLRLEEHEKDSRHLAGNEPSEVFSHTIRLFTDLADKQDWFLLRQQAERHVKSTNSTVATWAKRMLALAFANSDEPMDKERAIQYYQSLSKAESADFSDIGNLAILLVENGYLKDATAMVFDGIKRFHSKAGYFAEIGQRIVEATGDRSLRKQIENKLREKA